MNSFKKDYAKAKDILFLVIGKKNMLMQNNSQYHHGHSAIELNFES